MLLTNRLLLLFFFRAFWMKTIVDQVQAQATKTITYGALNPNQPALNPNQAAEPAITVGSSVTTDDNSSWISPSGHFAFGFYGESDGFFVGIQLIISPTETVVVWTARPDLKRFSKDAFLNFTEEGLFVTPKKEAVAIPLLKFSSNATFANILENGNFVVYGSDNSNISGTSEVVKPGVTYTRGCNQNHYCRTSSDIIIWRSFDFPTDTILGDQNLSCGSSLTSSAGKKDHSIGKYILNFPCGGASLVFYGLNSSRKEWDTGASDGDDYKYLNLGDDGRLYLTSSGGNEKDIFDYKPNKDTSDVIIYRATLDGDNIFRLYAHNLQDKSNKTVFEIPYIRDNCQTKGIKRKWELALTEEIAPRYFSYKELRKASNEFNQQLGKGGHGTVFRADLPIGDSTVPVAVKRLHGAEMEGEREFQAEMRLIGRAYHANIVRLLGFCHDGPSRLIVYELMSRCSLAKHIFENRGRRPSWERRMAILLAAARGIHYLHCECETKIIHRDIKPENILIAEDWTAKIADFGLAKLLNKNQTRAATRTLAVGTEGYVAPEVDGRSEEAQVSEKADVYSYGIVVLETICSKRNREVKDLRKMSLCEMVRESYAANELWNLVDGDEVAALELEKLVKIGLLCVQEDPDARPVMEDVVMMLEGDIDVPTPSSLLTT